MRITAGLIIQFASEKEKEAFDLDNGKNIVMKLNEDFQKALDKMPPVWRAALETSRIDLIFSPDYHNEKAVN